jgi:hypothetical protein
MRSLFIAFGLVLSQFSYAHDTQCMTGKDFYQLFNQAQKMSLDSNHKVVGLPAENMCFLVHDASASTACGKYPFVALKIENAPGSSRRWRSEAGAAYFESEMAALDYLDYYDVYEDFDIESGDLYSYSLYFRKLIQDGRELLVIKTYKAGPQGLIVDLNKDRVDCHVAGGR